MLTGPAVANTTAAKGVMILPLASLPPNPTMTETTGGEASVEDTAHGNESQQGNGTTLNEHRGCR